MTAGESPWRRETHAPAAASAQAGLELAFPKHDVGHALPEGMAGAADARHGAPSLETQETACESPAADCTEGPEAKRRTKRPRIDLDDSIQEARAAMQKAMKEVAEARRVAKNERRKKQRLIKKAGHLSAEDLERIAVLKRCGLSHGSSGSSAPPSTAASTVTARGSERSCAAASPVCSPVAEAALPPSATDRDEVAQESTEE